MATYRVMQGQNVFDLAIQLYGDISKSVQIMIDNPNITYVDDIPVGAEITYTAPINNAIVNFFTNKKVSIATNNTNEPPVGAFDESFNLDFN